MNKVTRNEILAVPDYLKIREQFRQSVLDQKNDRRIHLGEHLTFLFETHDTILYQIQEMMRAEAIMGEPEIEHEIETYNELLGDRGELGATLLIEIDDRQKRDELLRKWKGLPGALYIGTADGARVAAVFDPRQVGEDRISSVHYLKFPVGDRVVERIGTTHPDLALEVALTPRQSAVLTADLAAQS